jgi:quercetin dioxygenase-like cupin family protein
MEAAMDRQTFEAELRREGYDVLTSTTAAAKVNPEHSHPFDVKALVLKGAITLTWNGRSQTFKPGETFGMPRGCRHFESYGPAGAVLLLGRRM